MSILKRTTLVPIDQCSYVGTKKANHNGYFDDRDTDSPLPVSIIITNHNYARYVDKAISSALDQTWRSIQVIVVDDGSTDNSREVIARYANHVTTVFQDNKGQAAAFNAGFARARGKIILFLDADDILSESTVALVVEEFCCTPHLAKVQWRLQWMDAQGISLPAFTPPENVSLPDGFLLPRLFQFPDDIPFSPTSGNAYPDWVLENILPMPEQEFRLCADYYLLQLAPLYGPISSLPEIGGRYRVHGANGHHTAGLDLDHVRRIIKNTQSAQIRVHQVAGALGYYDNPQMPIEDLSVTFLAHRLVSCKLAREHHPVIGDTPSRLALQGIRSSLARPDLAASRRLKWALWFPLVAIAPLSLSRRLATAFYQQPACVKRDPLKKVQRRGRRTISVGL